MYNAKNLETGDVIEMTEKQVRAEIIKDFQNDMGTVFGEGKSDEDIVQDVNLSDVSDFFSNGLYEGETYEITAAE